MQQDGVSKNAQTSEETFKWFTRFGDAPPPTITINSPSGNALNSFIVDDVIKNRRNNDIKLKDNYGEDFLRKPTKTRLKPLNPVRENNNNTFETIAGSFQIDNGGKSPTFETAHTNETTTPASAILLTPNNPKLLQSNLNFEAEDTEFNATLESLSFFLYLKIGILKENSEPKYFEEYKALSQHNLFFITAWFRYLGTFFILVVLTMYHFSDSDKSLVLYFVLFPIELFCNLWLNYATCCKAKNKMHISLIQICRTVMSSAIGFVLQMYYSTLPMYLLAILKIIIACHIYGDHIITSLISTAIFISGALYSLSLLGASSQTISDMCLVMTSISLFCLFFSKIYAEEKRNHYKQRFSYLQEKYLSNEKTHMIANISHEARNPLHGIIGASTILRHDMEKSSHTDKRKKRGRKNSILHSPCSTKGGLLHVMSEDGHYSSDCESSSGESTEQPYLELVNDIYNNANLLLHIFSTSLQMTSLEMGNIKLKNEAFNLLDTIESVVSVFYNIAADKNVSLHSFVDLNNLPNQVMGDHVRVSQILMNFISNSIKYSSSESGDSSVVIKCALCSDEDLKKLNVDKENIIEMLDDKEDIIFVKIDCIDNGKGIEKENINKLFKPFQTFGLSSSNMESSGTVFDQYYLKSISGNSKGSNGTSLLLSNRTGVGLNISKQLIEKMKGCIIVSSEVGKGTTMSVIFPFKKSMETPQKSLSDTGYIQSSQLISLSAYLADFNVYIIDSELLFLQILKDYIAQICPKCIVKEYVDTSKITEFDESRPLIVIYSEGIHYEVKQLLKLVQCEKILIPIGNRGRTRKYANMKYLIKPLRFGDTINALHEKMEKHRKKVNQTITITPPPEISISIDASPDLNIANKVLDVVTGRSILITDDNLINRKVMEKMVRLLGFTEIDLASNGLECFEMYKQKQYSIILLDLLMPVMCGKQSVKHIREYEEKEGKGRTPVIAITANIWESVDALSEIGFDSIIYKPILIEKLREEIEKLTHSDLALDAKK